MPLFNDTFGVNDLKPDQFKNFTLEVMDGYFVDLSQSMHQGGIARSDGSVARRDHIGREIRERLTAYGATLTPNLLIKIIRTFKIHGPTIPDEFAAKNREARIQMLVEELRQQRSEAI